MILCNAPSAVTAKRGEAECWEHVLRSHVASVHIMALSRISYVMMGKLVNFFVYQSNLQNGVNSIYLKKSYCKD